MTLHARPTELPSATTSSTRLRPEPGSSFAPDRPGPPNLHALWIGRRWASGLISMAILCATLLPVDSHAARRKPAHNSPPPQVDYSVREDVRGFVREVAERHGLDEPALLAAFASIRRDAQIIRLMEPPKGNFKRSWAVYRERFLDPLRQREGARFWQENDAALRRASEQFGVPAEIIVAIIGVETLFGRITGDFRVMDALTVLGFDYPRRAAFFRSELEQFLLFARENRLDPFSVRGSFAGAIGLPQFMPGSIRRFALDFDGDNRIDLRGSSIDAVGSVAKFLADHGWVRDQPTHFTLQFDDEQRLAPLLASGIEPRYRKSELNVFGVRPDLAMSDDLPVALIDLPNGDAPASYFLGTRNFYVITRYNRSSFYAMAVIELASALRTARDRELMAARPSRTAGAAALAVNVDQPGKRPVDR